MPNQILQKVSLCLVLTCLLGACSSDGQTSSDTTNKTNSLDQLNPAEMQVVVPPSTLRGLSNDLRPPK